MSLDPAVVAALERLEKTGSDENFARREKVLQLVHSTSNRALCLAPVAVLCSIPAKIFEFLVVEYSLMALTIALLMMGTWGVFWGTSRWLQPENWAPLSAVPLKCTEALSLVRKHQPTREVRDRVLASGRQLYVMDLLLMQEAVQEELGKAAQVQEVAARETAAEEQRQRCAELHGLT